MISSKVARPSQPWSLSVANLTMLEFPVFTAVMEAPLGQSVLKPILLRERDKDMETKNQNGCSPNDVDVIQE